MPQPHIFPLERRLNNWLLGDPPLLPLNLPPPETYLRIFGVTRDSAGNALAACTVTLYQTANDCEVDKVVADANGAYEFRSASLTMRYYVVAYKAGSPDVAGTTVNTLVGA